MYEVLAIRYATFAGRAAGENFIMPVDAHDAPMPLDYFVWLIRGEGCNILVDTGFNADAGARRKRLLTIPPEVALTRLGVAPEEIDDLIVTHLHYDHAGNFDRFPNARLHIQDRELSYATGRCMCHPFLRHPYDVEPVVQMVRCVHAERVTFHDGASTVRPGIEVHRIGGHSEGLQAVRVETASGPVVLASDAAHFYANYERQNPFPLVSNAVDMVEGWRTLHRLSGKNGRIVPGHDPEVGRRYARADVEGVDAFCLHIPPK